MDDHIFDAVTVLCYAAEDEGFIAVAEALELVLDVYLLEREQLKSPDPIFRSKRAELEKEQRAWMAPEPPTQIIGWSMNTFPLTKVG